MTPAQRPQASFLSAPFWDPLEPRSEVVTGIVEPWHRILEQLDLNDTAFRYDLLLEGRLDEWRKDLPELETWLEDPDAGSDPHDQFVSVKIHSDVWTCDDRLGYRLYAKAIAKYLAHPDTEPPLTIAVLAPWGRGKTSLMRLVEVELKAIGYSQSADESSGRMAAEQSGHRITHAEQVRRRMRGGKKESAEEDRRSDGDREGDEERAKIKDLKAAVSPGTSDPSGRLRYPTVWFNAWKFQSSDELWAGLAHAIVSQLVGKIDSRIERERFWLSLQARRLDYSAVRRDIHRLVFERFVGGIAWVALAALVVAGLIAGLSTVQPVSGASAAVASGTFVVGTAVKWLWDRARVLRQPLEGSFERYVRQPDYSSKRGFFVEVEQDVRRVFQLLVDKKEPAVVFVDDLDRCSPSKVADVIEAINLFLSGDLPRCYFVMGMDAQMVAASLEVAHKALDQRMSVVTRSYGSLGWYFMDKFVQLPFVIPSLSETQRKQYMAWLFGSGGDSEGPPQDAGEDEMKDLERTIERANLRDEATLDHVSERFQKLRRHSPEKAEALGSQLIERGAQEFTKDDPGVAEQLSKYAAYLGSDPRTMKRFVNLFRFYRLIQLSRRAQGLESASADALGHWLLVMLRWPQLVRWIQWEEESRGLSQAADPVDRARDFETHIAESADLSAWSEHLGKDAPAWCRDPDLYRLLCENRSRHPLHRAVEIGLW